VTGPGATLRTTKLPNGLEVVVARRASGPVVAVTLAARGGDADAEPLGAADLADYAGVRDGRHGLVQSVGMREYQWSGASTSYLAYRGASGNLSNALGRMFDVVDSSRVGSGTDAVVALWNRQRAERLFALPAQRAARQLRAALYAGTPLARTPSPADVAKVGTGDANGWIERTWAPANSVLTIVGDVDPDFAVAAAGSFLGGWKRKAPALPPVPAIAGRSVDEPVPQVGTDRADAQQTTLSLACVVPVKSPAQLAAVRVLAERLETRMHQAARLALGATYGFAGDVRLARGLAELNVHGAVEERALPRITALMKRDAEALGKEPISADELGRIRWREGITSSFRNGRSFELSRALADLRLSGLPEDTLERYPTTLAALTPEEVTAAGTACRSTAVIQVVGPTAVVQRMSGSR
jgi:predicted Zn-dependent peptidase